MNINKFYSQKYMRPYQENYKKLLRYERDLMRYINWLDYEDMADDLMRYISWLDYKDNPDDYLKNVKIVNFDIINHECRGYPLQGTYKGYKTIEKK